jgi:hypothetical protein
MIIGAQRRQVKCSEALCIGPLQPYDEVVLNELHELECDGERNDTAPDLSKGFPMIPVLLLCAILFQTDAPTLLKPVIDNDRVAVWDVTTPATARSFDSVVVSLSGSAMFVPQSATPKFAGRSMVIELKDHPVTPIENKSGYPLAFPRPGSKKILENARVIVWDYSWAPDVATPMHFHDKDVVVVFLDDGDLTSTTPDGKVAENSYKAGMVRFNVRNRTHTETLIRGKQRAIITELK